MPIGLIFIDLQKIENSIKDIKQKEFKKCFIHLITKQSRRYKNSILGRKKIYL